MAQLLVRDVDDELVRILKRRAAANGRSAEEEHRQLLRSVLAPLSLLGRLLEVPDVGDDADFDRIDELPRDVDW